MPVTPERFAQGMTYNQFKAQMTRNRERFEANEQAIELTPADLEPFQNLPRPLNVLVLAEDWCGDVIDNLPILGRIAQATGKLNLRIFLRDQNLDLMDQYLNQGAYRSIPVFVVFDESFQEIGRFIERPASVTERRERRRQEIYAAHPEFGSPDTPIGELPEEVRSQIQAALVAMRAELKPIENREVIQALAEIVRQVPATPAASG